MTRMIWNNLRQIIQALQMAMNDASQADDDDGRD